MTQKARIFTTSRMLAFGDCDPSGIAYFPRYLHHLVTVLEDFFAEIGHPWPAMIAERRIGTPTLKLDLTFVKPGLHGDKLDFALRLRGLGRSSMDLEHQVSSAGSLLWSAHHRIVATSLETHKSCPWPADMRAAFMPYLENDHAQDPAT